ncbi:uncharacterized protein TNCV_2480481 [Trichonephila clavipes]|nr:uncharacterized protein TNCV_2480481 [Trichonephila clavipes]
MRRGRIWENNIRRGKNIINKGERLTSKSMIWYWYKLILLVLGGRRVVGKFMPKFEGPYRVLEVRNNNLTIWKKGRRVTVNIDQVRRYHPRHSDTSSFDSINESLYEGKGSSNWSNRSNSGKSRRSRKPSGNESKSCKSNKGTA